MRISVIIPVLNEAKTIGSTLESLCRLQADEIIVVDGGSTDGTRERVLEKKLGLSVFLGAVLGK